MSNDEVLRLVFPYLGGADLAACSSVSKQWRGVAADDYLWKCLCAKRWPSVTKRRGGGPPPALTYQKLYGTFHKRQQGRALPPPRISFDDLEFFFDIWSDDRPIFSEAVPGAVLRAGFEAGPLPPGAYVGGPEYKMTLPVEPRFTVPAAQTVGVSVLVERRDSNRVACVVDKSEFDYVDRTSCRAMAFDFLELSPVYPFVSGVRAWVSLLFAGESAEGALDVFGIQMDFCDAANSEEEVLWLLDMLDWK